MFNLAGLTVDPPLVLAPMAGLTDSPLRRLLRSLPGCGLVTTEFVSSEALVREVPAEVAKLVFAPEERPIAIQVYGTRPEALAEAARQVEAAGADVCDLNLGCPARAVMRGGAGAALLARPELVSRLVRAMRAATGLPLTVKLRSGLRPSEPRFLEIARVCEGEGVDGVTLHPRAASVQYGGRADWRQIAELKAALSVPVIGNGDVQTGDDAVRMVRETGCDGVMIGRAAVVDPWVFAAAAACLEGREPPHPTVADRRSLASRHLDLLAAAYKGRALVHAIKVFLRLYTRGLPEGRVLRRRLGGLDDPEALRQALEEFFAQLTADGDRVNRD